MGLSTGLTRQEVIQEEAQEMAQAIQRFKKAGVRGSDIAVLFPKHVYGDKVEEALLRQYIPYRRYGNVSIMNRYAAGLAALVAPLLLLPRE